jgi:hypothetical protein
MPDRYLEASFEDAVSGEFPFEDTDFPSDDTLAVGDDTRFDDPDDDENWDHDEPAEPLAVGPDPTDVAWEDRFENGDNGE